MAHTVLALECHSHVCSVCPLQGARGVGWKWSVLFFNDSANWRVDGGNGTVVAVVKRIRCSKPLPQRVPFWTAGVPFFSFGLLCFVYQRHKVATKSQSVNAHRRRRRTTATCRNSTRCAGMSATATRFAHSKAHKSKISHLMNINVGGQTRRCANTMCCVCVCFAENTDLARVWRVNRRGRDVCASIEHPRRKVFVRPVEMSA